MNIETKTSPGATVFFMKDNEVATGMVTKVCTATAINDGKTQTGINYTITNAPYCLWESQIFHTKEELLKSL